MKYRIYPVPAGRFTVTFNLEGFPPFPGIKNIPSYLFLVVDENGEAVVVDTGFDIDNIPGIDSHGVCNINGQIPDLIKKTGIDPVKIKKIILTHMHWDHTAGIKHFPEAEIYVQAGEIGCLFNLMENEEISFNPGHWFHRLDNFVLLDGNSEILPGIEVIRTGGHTPGHQAVKIQCENRSVMLIGDLPFSYEWLWTRLPAVYWEKFREIKGEKFYWKDELLPEIERWYRGKKFTSDKILKDLTTKDVQTMADILVFSHEKNLTEKKYL